MKQYNSYLVKIILFIKKIVFYFIPIKPSKFIYPNLPYFSQWESQDLVDDILNHTIKAENDPKWRNSGAKNKLEYLNWSWNICGMACLKMIIKTERNINIPLVSLAKNGLRYGTYKINTTNYKLGKYLRSIDGLYYQPFINFIKKEFDLDGKIVSPLLLKEILYYLSKRYYIIASVHGSIRNPKNIPKKQGGHLVLISGYDIPKKTLYLHNPSGYYSKSQEYAEISFSDFERFFANRGILIRSRANDS